MRSRGFLEQQRIRIGRDREVAVVVRDRKGAVRVLDLQFAVLEHLAVLVAQNRHDQLELAPPALILSSRAPVDVEEAGVDRGWPVFEHVEPAEIARVADAHVVGHDVGELAHPVAL